MKHYIYSNKIFRCRIKTTGYENQLELQLQKKWLFFWVNVYKWKHIKEGFWGENDRLGVMQTGYRSGNVSESYPTGTFNLKEIVDSFFFEYHAYLLKKINLDKQLKELFQS